MTTTSNTAAPGMADILAQAISDIDRLHHALQVLRGTEFMEDDEHIGEYLGAYTCLRAQLSEAHSQVLIGDLHPGYREQVEQALEAWRDSVAIPESSSPRYPKA